MISRMTLEVASLAAVLARPGAAVPADGRTRHVAPRELPGIPRTLPAR